MFLDITNALKLAVSSCLEWLVDFWASIDSTVMVLFFTFFAILTFVRLILFPLLGFSARSVGSSDRVRWTETTTYKPFKTSDGSTWYSSSTYYRRRK